MTQCLGFIKVPAGNFSLFLSRLFKEFLPVDQMSIIYPDGVRSFVSIIKREV